METLAIPAPVIDVHAHAVPSALIEHLRDGRHGVTVRDDPGGIRLDIGGRRTPAIGAGLTDPALRLAAMDRMGVDVQLVSPWMELTPDELGPRDAARFVRLLNDSLGDLVDHAPSRLRSLALVDRRDPASAATDLRRLLDTGRFQGAEIGLGGAGPALHEPDWDPFWDAASRTGALVLAHPWRPSSPAGIAFPHLADVVDNPAQSTAAIGAMALAGTFRRFPDLRLCVVHGGGFLPYAAGRFDAIAAAGTSLRPLYFDSLTHSPQALSWLVEFAGADRVMLGSDYPFPTGCADPVGAVGHLPGEQRAAVLGGTARSLSAPRRP